MDRTHMKVYPKLAKKRFHILGIVVGMFAVVTG